MYTGVGGQQNDLVSVTWRKGVRANHRNCTKATVRPLDQNWQLS